MNNIIQNALYRNYFKDSLESLLNSIEEPVHAVQFSFPTEETPYLSIRLSTIKDLSNIEAVMNEYCPLFASTMSLSVITVSGGVMNKHTIYRDSNELDTLVLKHNLYSHATNALDGTKIELPVRSIRMAECVDIVNAWQKKNSPVVNSSDLSIS